MEVFAAWEFGFEPGGFLFDTEVMDRVVLVVEDHGAQGEGGLEVSDGVAAEGSWVAGEGLWVWGVDWHLWSLCRSDGRFENGDDLSGVERSGDCCASGETVSDRGSAKVTERPKRMRFSGSESTCLAFVVDEAGYKSLVSWLSGATLLHRAVWAGSW